MSDNKYAKSRNRLINIIDLKLADISQILLPLIVIVTLGILWEVWINIADLPSYLLPPPSEIFFRLFGDFWFFVRHGLVTLVEAICGLVVGSAIAISLAILMRYWKILERTLFPIALLIKVTPIIAVAPLFVIWFGFGSGPKILIVALITFFPVMVNTLVGLKSVNMDSLDFLKTLNASEWEIMIHLRIPSALPYLFAALRISLPLSIIGAVVGEWFTGDRGLGSVIIVAHNNIDMPTLFSSVFSLAFIGVSLTIMLVFCERKILFWHDSNLRV